MSKHPDLESCIHKQPSASMCFVCGRDNERGLKMSFFDNGDDLVYSKVIPDSIYQGYPGVVHGGLLATILDEVVGRVVMAGDHHKFMMTVTMDVKYRKPTPVGEELLALGRKVKVGSRLARASGQILLIDGSVACEAQLTLATMPSDLADGDAQSKLDWRID